MILDTNAISDLFAGHLKLRAALQGTVQLSLPSIVLGEYRYGLSGSRQQKSLETLLQMLENWGQTPSIQLLIDQVT
jgi:predicted nucleic acid-binding protein